MGINREEANEYYRRGLEHLERGEYEDAELLLRRALALKPDLTTVLVALSRLAYEQGSYEQAAERAREALIFDPRLGDGYQWLSVALRELGRLEEAIEAGKLAMALTRSRPLLIEALGQLIQTCSEAQLYPDVITHSRHLLETGHQEPWVYNALGWAYSQQDEEGEADRCFREALDRSAHRGHEAGYACVQLAWLACARKDTTEVLSLLQQAVEADPDDLETRLAVARLYRELGRAQEAVEVARAALALAETESEEAEARSELGEACMEAEAFAEAADHYRRITELHPDDIWAQLWLSCAFRQSGMLGRAIEVARIALEMAGSQDDRAEAYLQLAHAQLEVGDLDRALECYREATTLAPRDARARAELGHAYGLKQDWEQAEQCFQESVELAQDPEDLAEAWADLAWIANERAYHPLAEQRARQALGEDPDHAHAWLMLCWSLRVQGHIEEALAAVEQALDLARDQHERADSYIEMGHTCSTADRLTQAAECYQRALDLGHEDAATYDALGWVLYNKRRLPQAERCFQAAISYDPCDPWPLRNLGLLYLDTNRLPEAIASCRRAVAVNPTHAPSHLALACCYHERDPGQAIKHNLRALELDQSSPDARHNLAQLYLDSDRIPEAELLAYEAAALLPDDPELQAGLAQVLLRAGKHEEALAAAEHAVSLDQHLTFAWRCAGLAAQALGRSAQACRYFHHAVELGDQAAVPTTLLAGKGAFSPER